MSSSMVPIAYVVLTSLKSSLFGVILCDMWSCILSEQKWVSGNRETINNTVRAPHRYTTPWWMAALHYWNAIWWDLNENSRTMRNFWNVPDQIVTTSPEVMTADFCITNLGTPCITLYRNEKYMKCHNNAINLQGVILILKHIVQNYCCKSHIDRIGIGCIWRHDEWQLCTSEMPSGGIWMKTRGLGAISETYLTKLLLLVLKLWQQIFV